MPDHVIAVLLDTNIFVAAYWARSSASARLIQACIDGRLVAHYSDEVRQEVMHILRLIKAKPDYLDQVELFWERAIKVEAVPVDDVAVADPDDRKFLEAAAGGQTDFIVTNDDHLLKVRHIGRAEILRPRSALRLLRLQSDN